MHTVEPKVLLIARTEFLDNFIPSYLTDIGMEVNEAQKYMKNAVTDSERLVMFGGKLCYNSFKPGLNPNVSKTRDNPEEYLTNILKSCHGSVLEHANFTFIFWNISRVFTHELVRHRAGCAYSQESLRYVMPEDLGFFLPSIIKNSENASQIISDMKRAIAGIEDGHNDARVEANFEDMKFTDKKKWTSALRRILPQGMSTAIMCTMNLRAARHMVQMRTSRHAEEEIRIVYNKVGELLEKELPILFGDFTKEEVDGILEWRSPYPANPYDYNKEG